MNQTGVVEAFVQGKVAKASALRSTGYALMSYAMMLAHHDKEKGCVVFDYPKGYRVSVTTSRHMRLLERRVCRDE